MTIMTKFWIFIFYENNTIKAIPTQHNKYSAESRFYLSVESFEKDFGDIENICNKRKSKNDH